MQGQINQIIRVFIVKHGTVIKKVINYMHVEHNYANTIHEEVCAIGLLHTYYIKRVLCCGINTHNVYAQSVGELFMEAPGISTRQVGVTKTTMLGVNARGLSRFLLEALLKRE